MFTKVYLLFCPPSLYVITRSKRALETMYIVKYLNTLYLIIYKAVELLVKLGERERAIKSNDCRAKRILCNEQSIRYFVGHT